MDDGLRQLLMYINLCNSHLNLGINLHYVVKNTAKINFWTLWFRKLDAFDELKMMIDSTKTKKLELYAEFSMFTFGELTTFSTSIRKTSLRKESRLWFIKIKVFILQFIPLGRDILKHMVYNTDAVIKDCNGVRVLKQHVKHGSHG